MKEFSFSHLTIFLYIYIFYNKSIIFNIFLNAMNIITVVSAFSFCWIAKYILHFHFRSFWIFLSPGHLVQSAFPPIFSYFQLRPRNVFSIFKPQLFDLHMKHKVLQEETTLTKILYFNVICASSVPKYLICGLVSLYTLLITPYKAALHVDVIFFYLLAFINL